LSGSPSNFSRKGTRRGLRPQPKKAATKLHEGAQRKKEYPNHPNEKLLEVQKPFLEKVFGRRRQIETYRVEISSILCYLLLFETAYVRLIIETKKWQEKAKNQWDEKIFHI
jgi:hypothetical protein